MPEEAYTDLVEKALLNVLSQSEVDDVLDMRCLKDVSVGEQLIIGALINAINN